MKKITSLSTLALMHTVAFAAPVNKDIPISVVIPTTLEAKIDGQANFTFNASNTSDTKDVTLTVMSNKKHDVSMSTSCELTGKAVSTNKIPFTFKVAATDHKSSIKDTKIATDASATTGTGVA